MSGIVYVVTYEDQPNLSGNIVSSARKALTQLAEYGPIDDPMPYKTLYSGAPVEVAGGRAQACRYTVG